MTPGPLIREGRNLEKRIVSWCLERIDLPVAGQSMYDARTHLMLLLRTHFKTLLSTMRAQAM